MTHFSITTPIYYVNAEPHIGHTYTTIVADTVARYHRLIGDETFLLTGTDEHGDKIAEAAEAQGTDPAGFADRVSGIFRSTWEELGISHDRFIRTTDPDHIRAVQHFLGVVHDKGDIDFREYAGLYCVGCERFLTERDLVDGLCRDHERAPEERTGVQLLLSDDELFRLRSASSSRNTQSSSGRNATETKCWPCCAKGAVSTTSASPAPRNPAHVGHRAPFRHGLRLLCLVRCADQLSDRYAATQINPAGKSAGPACEHVIGKDILKPHGVFWPCMLMAADLPLYKHLNVHGHWNVDDRKVSKSLGNMISPLAMRDQLRLRCVPLLPARETCPSASTRASAKPSWSPGSTRTSPTTSVTL